MLFSCIGLSRHIQVDHLDLDLEDGFDSAPILYNHEYWVPISQVLMILVYAEIK